MCWLNKDWGIRGTAVLLPCCQRSSHEKQVFDKRQKNDCVCIMQDGAVIPTLRVQAQLPGWTAVSVEDGLQDRCTYLGVLACSGDYWCTVGSFAAVVYFTSCGYIPVVVVSGTSGLLSVMRAYWIMPQLDSQRSFVANRHLDKTG